MSVHRRLQELLDQSRATYAILVPPATEPRKPPVRSSPGPPMAATAVIRHGGIFSLAVLPAHLRVDLPRLSAALRDVVELADESEIAAAFPDCEPDAVPPFGVLYGLKTYLDESLTHERTITFAAGMRAHAIRMPFEEYDRVAAPVVLWLAESMAGAEG